MKKENLVNWFLREKRAFPWREDPTPYRVWVSEIMLQQTRAEVVVSYYERWMARFPSVDALAVASELEVIKMWEGLGYYARARNLLCAARQIMTERGGLLPTTREEWLSLPGVGPYTASAICAFALRQRVVAIDGNVIRLLARWSGFDKRVSTSRALEELRGIGEPLLDKEHPWVSAEALIELGARVCTPRHPGCGECPLAEQCVARRDGRIAELPKRAPTAKVIPLRRLVAMVYDGSGRVLLQAGGAGKLMEGLWYFPYLELKDGEEPTALLATAWLEASLGVFPVLHGTLPSRKHTFTRYRAELFPMLFVSEQVRTKATSLGEWVELASISSLAFVAGHRSMLKDLLPFVDEI